MLKLSTYIIAVSLLLLVFSLLDELLLGLLLDVVEDVLVVLDDLLDLLVGQAIELMLPHELFHFPVVEACVVVDCNSCGHSLL